ncbi:MULTISPECIES: CDP-alcohol phosphatidyltransferase family protein [unclassified Roseovarius]|uniref:CDP-alcohol phosphatidyltransferase family protein n=1 Tax=unclassified Roseovarius TaxID=2614913 RepID=UPI00273E83C8|nr:MULTISPECIES: CDP-alcohol phosphatidyltransferase family protein [unclassified Roseovarius]
MTDRRPIASRNTGWAQGLTRALARTAITPNQISIASMVFAALAGLALYIGSTAEGAMRAALLLAAALCCQLRLICNLLDGLVAVEGGKGTPDGAFWNEAPDRVSDILILVGLGHGIGQPELGWAAATLAVGTAYIRELGRATTTENDFCGPMAKPQRMATVTLAAVIAAFWTAAPVLLVGLWIICIGAGATILRRSARMIARLRQGGNP